MKHQTRVGKTNFNQLIPNITDLFKPVKKRVLMKSLQKTLEHYCHSYKEDSNI